MPRSSALRELLPASPPCMLLFAPSRRAPDYEMQVEILNRAEEGSRRGLPVMIEVLAQGSCSVEGRVVDAGVGPALRKQMGVSDDAFCLVLVSADGEVIREFDTPVKPEAIADAFEEASG